MHVCTATGLRHFGPISGVASRGDLVATAGYDNQVILWDAHRREPLARANHDHLVNDCSFSPDGRWLVSASSDHSARVWSLPTLRLHAVLSGHADDVDMAAFSPDSLRIATCALDRCVRIFDLAGHCLHEMHGHTGNVLSLAWTRDGRRVVSSSVDGSIRTWDAERGCAERVDRLGARTDSVVIGATGMVYAGDDLGRIAIIDGHSTHFVQAHHAGVKRLALDAREGLLASLSYDGTMVLWRCGPSRNLDQIARATLPAAVWARAAAVLDDGRVAVGTFGSTYALYDPVTRDWTLDGVAAGSSVNAVLDVGGGIHSVGDAGEVRVDGVPVAQMGSLCNFLVAQGGRVFTGGQLGRIFDAYTGRAIYQHHSPLNCAVAFERVGERCVAVGSYTGEILVLRLGDDGGVQLVQTLQPYENAVKGLSCSDGLLFSVCASTAVAWHRIDNGALVRSIAGAHERIANACCDIGAGRFASVSRDRMLRLWYGHRAEVHASPHGHSIKCICVDGERRMILTGSYGGTLAAFDLAQKRWTRVLRPTAAGISSITWDAARGRFIAASYDGGMHPVERLS